MHGYTNELMLNPVSNLILAPLVILCFVRPMSASLHSLTSAAASATDPSIYCTTNTECVEYGSTGAPSCHWLYEGCPTGQCMCDPIRQKRHQATGKCISVRLGNEPCTGGTVDACPDGMLCRNGRCQCRHTASEMTADRQHCLHRGQKLLGQSCSSMLDTCFHKAVYGYTSNDIECRSSSGTCECASGGRREGITCRNLRLHERGCTRYHHCEGGAICIDRRCVCPVGYTSSILDDRCIKNGAVRDLALGTECDEINDRRYCAAGLVCHRCSDVDDAAYYCVRFRLTLTSDLGFLMSGASSARLRLPASMSFLPLLVALTISAVCVRVIVRSCIRSLPRKIF